MNYEFIVASIGAFASCQNQIGFNVHYKERKPRITEQT